MSYCYNSMYFVKTYFGQGIVFISDFIIFNIEDFQFLLKVHYRISCLLTYWKNMASAGRFLTIFHSYKNIMPNAKFLNDEISHKLGQPSLLLNL